MPRLLRGIARTAVVAGTATAVSGRVARRQQGRWAAQEQQQAEPAPQPVYAAAPPAAPPGPDAGTRFAQLAQLGELKSSGVLSEAEFEAEKAKILSS
jgi:hypothetical protein